jgi:hypothetical protein
VASAYADEYGKMAAADMYGRQYTYDSDALLGNGGCISNRPSAILEDRHESSRTKQGNRSLMLQSALDQDTQFSTHLQIASVSSAHISHYIRSWCSAHAVQFHCH